MKHGGPRRATEGEERGRIKRGEEEERGRGRKDWFFCMRRVYVGL